MAVDNNPQWLSIVTGPNVRTGSVDIGRQPNMAFGGGILARSDATNQQNVVEIDVAALASELSIAAGADIDAAYVVASLTASLPNARVLQAGPNITINSYPTAIGITGSSVGPSVPTTPNYFLQTSGTSGTAYYATIRPEQIAQGTYSGSFSGSLTQVAPGVPFITAIGGVSILTGALGQLTISSSVSAGNVASLTGAGATTVTNVGTAYTVSSSLSPAATNATLGTVILAGDLSGSAASPTVVSASIPAGIYPRMGSGYQSVTPSGGNPFDERRGDWVALTSDAATTIFTLPSALSASQVGTITCEIHISKDGANDYGIWRRAIYVRNNGGTLTTPSGGTTDTDNSGANNLGTGVSSATSKIDITVNPPVISVTRPSGVPCHARLEVVDYPRGSSGA